MTVDQTRKYKTLGELTSELIANGRAPNRAEAVKLARGIVPREKKFQEKILKHLSDEYPDAFIWKDQAGMYQEKGIPDVCAIINGRFYGFEIKRPFFGAPSKLQRQNIEKINRAGGVAGVVTYTEDVDALIERGARA